MTLVVLSLLQALAHGAAGSVSETRRPTIEPTLPLVVDMRLSGLDRHEGRARGRLHIDLTADGDLDQVEPTLALPGALRVVDGTALPPVFGLANGERRRFVLAVEGPDDLDLPIHLEVVFRNADGRTFHLGQGVTLQARRPGAGGRSQLGAWEVMAVPLEEVRR